MRIGKTVRVEKDVRAPTKEPIPLPVKEPVPVKRAPAPIPKERSLPVPVEQMLAHGYCPSCGTLLEDLELEDGHFLRCPYHGVLAEI